MLWHFSTVRTYGHCCVGAAATITGAATSAASVGIVTTSSGAAGAAYYSSKMAKRAADISEFGFVRLAEYQAYQAAAAAAAEAAPEADEPRDEPAAAAEQSPERASASQRMKASFSSSWGWGKAALRSSRSKLQREPSGGADVSPGAALAPTLAPLPALISSSVPQRAPACAARHGALIAAAAPPPHAQPRIDAALWFALMQVVKPMRYAPLCCAVHR